MKNIIILAILFCYTSSVAFAQQDHTRHQDKDLKKDTKANETGGSSQMQFSSLLSSYYNIKNALVAGDATSAASNAGLFLKTANTIDIGNPSANNAKILSESAVKISGTKDLEEQRKHFAGLSSAMATIAKSLKMANQPIYLQYCPMKKASWLSSEKAIKNPYYGSSMLTCGEVTETL